MTNLITLTIPNDDHIALRAFGKALEEMALAHGAPLQVKLTDTDVGKLKDAMNAEQPQFIQFYGRANRAVPEVDTTSQQVESLAVPGATHIITEQKLVGDPVSVGDDSFSQGYIATAEEIANPVDSTGTPWDERIHSTSKALNADGTWRLRRKPKDMDEAEWAAFVETVKLELNHGEEIHEAMDKAERGEAVYYTSEEAEQKMEEFKESKQAILEPQYDAVQKPININHVSIDPAPDEGDGTVEPPVTPPGDDFQTDADVVTEQTVAGIPPLPVPPPVVVAPPVPEVTEWDFPRLMTFLTERHGKIDVATVNTLLAQDGMLSVQELNAHPDKIGPFMARVKAYLGE